MLMSKIFLYTNSPSINHDEISNCHFQTLHVAIYGTESCIEEILAKMSSGL